MSKISFVIPVYNVKEYIERCVKSVLEQGEKDVELILVDDGSTDASGEICDALASQFSNISVIHKENGGLSDARNEGLKAAIGEYVHFLDSDDTLLPGSIGNFIERMKAEKSDVIIGQFKAVRESDGKVFFERDTAIKQEEIDGKCRDEVLLELKRAGISPTAWRYMLQREFLLKNDLFFVEGLLNEDAYWTPRMLLSANTFSLVETPFYLYNVRANSIMTSFNFKRCADLFLIAKKNYVFAVDKTEPEKEYIHSAICIMLNNALQNWPLFSKEQKKEVRAWFEGNQMLAVEVSKSRGDIKTIVRVCGPFFGMLLAATIVRLKNKLVGKS